MSAGAPARAPRVLVLEDDPDLLELIALLLESEQFEVRVGRDGSEGLACIARLGLPDVVLLDLMMPVMDGGEFARRFRARYGEAAPIVVITAADDARKRAAEVHAAAWLAKPFDLDALVRVLRGQLAAHPPAG